MTAPQLTPAARRREIDRLAGQVPDAELAKRLGCSRTTVVRRRRILGRLAAVRPQAPRIPITLEQLTTAGAGDVPDRVLAERLGCSVFSASLARRRERIADYRSREAPFKAALVEGGETDAELAARYGVAPGTVRAMRCRLGLPPAPRKPPPWRPLLGKVSDPEIARRFGVNRVVVCRLRRRLGIPAFAPGRGGR